MNKKILITGGAGFLGSHLVEMLIQHDNFIYCLDDLSTGNIKNIEEYINYPNFEFIESCITNDINLNVDEIYNFACPASPIHYQSDPIKTTKTCVIGVLNMLELAKANNAKILHASTSEVYGDPHIDPQNESYNGNVNPIGIRSCYDEGKRCAETLLFDFHRHYDLNIKVIRIFNTYGPRMQQNDGRVVSNFINQALNNSPITIYGDGKQTRSFCYVSDLIRGIILYMNLSEQDPGPINLGNPKEFNMLELADKVLTLTHSESKLIYKDLPEDDPKQRRPDITKAVNLLNWKPSVDLEEGIRLTTEYFKNL